MLNEHDVTHTYRDYTKQPLDDVEIRDVLKKLGMTAKDVLRSRDAKKAGLTGDESEDELISQMAENNRLIQRPILVDDTRAAMGRPVENLLPLIEG